MEDSENYVETSNETTSALSSTGDDYNDGYTHEALHTAHILLSMLDDHITASRCIAEFSDVKDAAGVAEDALYDLYQLIGQKFTDGA